MGPSPPLSQGLFLCLNFERSLVIWGFVVVVVVLGHLVVLKALHLEITPGRACVGCQERTWAVKGKCPAGYPTAPGPLCLILEGQD